MDKAIVDFIQALRHHGLPISPAETLDALHATAAIGVANRQRLKVGLSMTLAKTLPHRGLLEDLFDQVFALQESVEQGDDVGANGDGFSSSKSPSEDFPIQSALGQQLLTNQTAAMHLAMVRAAEEVGAKEMKIFLQKGRVASRILLQMGDRELQHELLALEQQGKQLGLVADLRQQRQLLVDRVKDHVEQQYLLFSGKRGEQLSEDTLRKIKFSHMDHIHQQQMARVVEKVARKLASLHSRRRKVCKRGLLDVRKTIAANAAYDGFLFHTRWKSTRVDRPRVLVICDLSRSVSQFAKFLLLFVYSLQEVLPRVRSFVFSSEMVEVTNAFKTYQRDEALSLIMEKWGNHSTDYGRALQDFSDHALKDIDHKTQVIMLGDARNNYDDGRIDIWQTIANRAQRVLWLNPEDRSRWNTGDSIMAKYAPFCAMVEQCNSLRDMERVLGRLLKYAN